MVQNFYTAFVFYNFNEPMHIDFRFLCSNLYLDWMEYYQHLEIDFTHTRLPEAQIEDYLADYEQRYDVSVNDYTGKFRPDRMLTDYSPSL